MVSRALAGGSRKGTAPPGQSTSGVRPDSRALPSGGRPSPGRGQAVRNRPDRQSSRRYFPPDLWSSTTSLTHRRASMRGRGVVRGRRDRDGSGGLGFAWWTGDSWAGTRHLGSTAAGDQIWSFILSIYVSRPPLFVCPGIKGPILGWRCRIQRLHCPYGASLALLRRGQQALHPLDLVLGRLLLVGPATIHQHLHGHHLLRSQDAENSPATDPHG